MTKIHEKVDDFAFSWPKMYDKKSREIKAKRMIIVLSNFLGKKSLSRMSLLDVGASTGIIDNTLAQKVGRVTGIDVDKTAIKFAKKTFHKKNLNFKVGDAMDLQFKTNSFNILICTHIYEHVPDSTKLFEEIYRVLKPGGVCYLAAMNSLWPIEPHYKLPFLSWLPRDLADFYISITDKAERYYEVPLNYWQLQKMIKNKGFTINDYTPKIFANLKYFGYQNNPMGKLVSPLMKYLAPTFFWIIKKP